MDNPTYEAVCRETTGYAEEVRLEFDSKALNFEQLLVVIWQTRNSTQMNRQGSNADTQYRSAIFPHDAGRKMVSRELKARLQTSGTPAGLAVTESTAAGSI